MEFAILPREYIQYVYMCMNIPTGGGMLVKTIYVHLILLSNVPESAIFFNIIGHIY